MVLHCDLKLFLNLKGEAYKLALADDLVVLKTFAFPKGDLQAFHLWVGSCCKYLFYLLKEMMFAFYPLKV